jgi:hypothetical protein
VEQIMERLLAEMKAGQELVTAKMREFLRGDESWP